MTEHECTTKIIRHLVDVLNKKLGLADSDDTNAEKWCFGYIGNVYGIPNTPAFRDDRLWTVWAPHPGRPGRDGENLGYVRTDKLDELRTRLVGALHLVNNLKAA